MANHKMDRTLSVMRKGAVIEISNRYRKKQGDPAFSAGQALCLRRRDTSHE